MKGTFLIIALLVFTTFTACKKDPITPASSTSTSTSNNTIYYGNYQGQNFETTTSTTSTSSVSIITKITTGVEVGVCVLSKGSNNSTIITGASFLSLPMVITGTNFVVNDTVVSSNVSDGVSSKQTVSGSGTINNKNLTFKSILTTTVVTSGNFGDSIVSVKTTTGSVQFVE
jgi:hypothetical protein